VNRLTTDAQTGTDHFDFMIEGLPTLVRQSRGSKLSPQLSRPRPDTLDQGLIFAS